MNIAKIEENIRKLITEFSKEKFIYEFLLAYGQPKSAITRLKQGTYNLSKEEGEILWKKKIFFKVVKKGDLHDMIDEAKKEISIRRQDPRFLIVTDYSTLLSVDTKTNASLDIKLEALPNHFDFFLPLSGLEKVSIESESAADVKAAEKMAKLYDQIRKDNPQIKDDSKVHELNVFLSRLLFCYFAEDTGIFEKASFTSSIASHTSPDGSDLDDYLDRLFQILNSKDRRKVPSFLASFPYVNGGLLAKKIKSPKFSIKSRALLIECGEMNWSEINPDIFGSMIQAVVQPKQRGGMGIHYTSVPNIMKVIRPLFLDELEEEFQKSSGNLSKLEKMLVRIYKIAIFDPACGSGNFLIIAYKELRKLEMRIFKAKEMLSKQASFQYSSLSLENFFGIEIDDFAHEIAMLSLWLAEHQMNILFKEQFGDTRPTLPLKSGGNIVCKNANAVDWEKICPKGRFDEVYLLGNPPYVGARNQSADQKKELQNLLNDYDGVNSLDYITAWFHSAAKFIKGIKGKAAFVSTNSVSQGEQVSLFWPKIFSMGIEIDFAYQSFKWSNMAKNAAVVTCVIICIRNRSTSPKYIYTNQNKKSVKNISPYLTENDDVFVFKRSKPLIQVDELVFGNQSIDGGYLILDEDEKNKLLTEEPKIAKYLRPLYSAEDFIEGKSRWCIWVSDNEFQDAQKIETLKLRFRQVKEYRKSGGEVARSLVDIPYRFRYIHQAQNNILILPRTTTENRDYLAVGFLDSKCIVTDAAQVIYDPQLYIFGFLSSRIHMVWVRSVAGRLKTDLRYSNQLCYNNFPFPEISDSQKNKLKIA
jgi:hypothetical protein